MELLILIVIIIITGLNSFRAFNDRVLFDKMKFNASFVVNSKEYFRLFTHALVHADWMHLIINMWVLFIFGETVLLFLNEYFGNFANLHFLALYAIAIPLSSISSLIKHKNNYTYNAVGASGAVSAVVFSSILFYPFGGIGLLFLPGISLPSWLFGLLYLIYSVVMSKRGRDNIGHDAHFWGAIWGIAYTLIIRPEVIQNFF